MNLFAVCGGVQAYSGWVMLLIVDCNSPTSSLLQTSSFLVARHFSVIITFIFGIWELFICVGILSVSLTN